MSSKSLLITIFCCVPGAVFASISATETLVNLVSAVSSNALYIATIKLMRGFIFLMYASFNAICVVLMM